MCERERARGLRGDDATFFLEEGDREPFRGDKSFLGASMTEPKSF